MCFLFLSVTKKKIPTKNSRAFGRIDRFDLRWAMTRWMKQIRGMELAKLEEMNTKLAHKLIGVRSELLVTNEDMNDTLRRRAKKRSRDASAGSGSIGRHLRSALDSQIAVTSRHFIRRYVDRRNDVDLVRKTIKAGDLCTLVTVLCGESDEYVINLDEKLTFSKLLDEVLERWKIAHGNASAVYHLAEYDEKHDDLVILPPDEHVRRYFCESDKEPIVHLVKMEMPGYEQLQRFSPSLCFAWLRDNRTEERNVESYEEVWEKYIEPHMWSVLWIFVVLALACVVVLEVTLQNHHFLHRAIEIPVKSAVFDAKTFESIVTTRDALKFVYFSKLVLYNQGEYADQSAFRTSMLEYDEYMYVRQYRSKNGDGNCCTVADFMPDGTSCYCPYNSDVTRSTTSFGTSSNGFGPFEYSDAGKRSQSTIVGSVGTYHSGAFYTRLNYTDSTTLDIDLVSLVNDGFVDEQTRALMFQNRFLSPSDGLLATQILMFEFDVAGTFVTHNVLGMLGENIFIRYSPVRTHTHVTHSYNTGTVVPTYLFSVQSLKNGEEWNKVTTYFWILASINVITIFLFILDSSQKARLVNRDRLGMGKAYHKRTALNMVCRDGFMALQIALSVVLLLGSILKIIVLVETPSVSTVSSEFLTVSDDTVWADDYFHLAQIYNAALFLDTLSLILAMGVLIDKLRIFRSFWIFVRSVELSSKSFFMIMIFVIFATIIIALIAANAFGERSSGVVFSSYVSVF